MEYTTLRRKQIAGYGARGSRIGGICILTVLPDLEAIAACGCFYHRLTRLLGPAR